MARVSSVFEEKLNLLYTLLSMAEKGALAICICSSPALRREFIQELSSRLQRDKIKIFSINLDESHKGVVRAIKTTMESKDFQEVLQNSSKVALSISGLENTILPSEREFTKRPESLQILNQQRDYFLEFNYSVLFWIPEWLAWHLPKLAPDFWVIRTSIFEFRPAHEERRHLSQQLARMPLYWEDAEELNRKIRIYEKLLKGIEKDTYEKVDLRTKLGYHLLAKGEHREARSSFIEGLRIAKKLEDKSWLASALSGFGIVQFQRGNYKQAISSFRKGLEIVNRAGDKEGISWLLYLLSMTYFTQGNFEQALELCEQSLNLAEESGEKECLINSLSLRSMLYINQRNYEKAMELGRQSLKLSEETENKILINQNSYLLGVIHQLVGDYIEARKLYKRSLENSQNMGLRLLVPFIFAQLGSLHEEEERFNEALDNYSEAVQFLRELESPFERMVQEDLIRIKSKILSNEGQAS